MSDESRNTTNAPTSNDANDPATGPDSNSDEIPDSNAASDDTDVGASSDSDGGESGGDESESDADDGQGVVDTPSNYGTAAQDASAGMSDSGGDSGNDATADDQGSKNESDANSDDDPAGDDSDSAAEGNNDDAESESNDDETGDSESDESSCDGDPQSEDDPNSSEGGDDLEDAADRDESNDDSDGEDSSSESIYPPNYVLLAWGEEPFSWDNRTLPEGAPSTTPQDAGISVQPANRNSNLSVARTSSDLDHANGITLPMIRIRLFDSDSKAMAGAPYKLSIDRQTWVDSADSDGWIERYVNVVPPQCQIEWGVDSQTGEYLYSSAVYLAMPQSDEDIARLRLQNLGYSLENSLAANLYDFKNDYGFDDDEDLQAVLANWHKDPGSVKERCLSSTA